MRRTFLAALFVISTAVPLAAAETWSTAYKRGDYATAATLLHRAVFEPAEGRAPDPIATRQLALLYAECRTAEPTRQLEQAEGWLREHSQDAALLYALGVLCERQQLWGKARTYLEASLALEDTWRTHVALGELLVQLERNDEANAHLAAALKLAVSELTPVS